MIFILLVVVTIVVIIAIAIHKSDSSHPYSGTPWIFESEAKRAGRRGENVATNVIRSVLRKDDYL